MGAVGEAIGEAFNLASGTESKIIDIANKVNEITGNHNGVRFFARRDWDKISRRRASIEKARRVLGYEPKMPIEDGIRKTLNWIEENRAKIDACANF